MLARLFESPMHLLLLVIVLVLLFGAKRMPDAARGLGRSMRILKSEVRDMKAEEQSGAQQQAQLDSSRPKDPSLEDETRSSAVKSTSSERTTDL